MAALTSGNPPLFQGVPRKIRIVSNNICYGPPPAFDEEVEQRVTINTQGRVWFSGYNFGGFGARHNRARSKIFTIGRARSQGILDAVAAYFSHDFQEIFATDIDLWTLEITDADGGTYSFSGSLCADLTVNGADLSDIIRGALGMDDLYVFDGNCRAAEGGDYE